MGVDINERRKRSAALGRSPSLSGMLARSTKITSTLSEEQSACFADSVDMDFNCQDRDSTTIGPGPAAFAGLSSIGKQPIAHSRTAAACGKLNTAQKPVGNDPGALRSTLPVVYRLPNTPTVTHGN
jgi:hypothetical protein